MFKKKKVKTPKSVTEQATNYMNEMLTKTFNIMPIPIKEGDSDMKNKKTLKDCEWVWVTGYKGTDRNMCCRDYQFDLEKQHDLPEGEEPELCSKGFHFCTDLNDVFRYYGLGEGNRFFEVRALVKKNGDIDDI